jgi:hypothetical protein
MQIRFWTGSHQRPASGAIRGETPRNPHAGGVRYLAHTSRVRVAKRLASLGTG